MPRHLISDAHEWMNEIPTVPTYYLAKPQPRERAWQNQRGKKTLLSLTLVWHCEETLAAAGEIPLLLSFFHLPGEAGSGAPSGPSVLASSGPARPVRDPLRGQWQVS
uniref:Uncharacterized protein n=1 Tax=Gasterosteus aculeatus aculeatus TaxID=481459 RepID=A0AAQ4RK92_GASAC